ncbi:hypothetical protein CCY99_03120 [Helicobacter sp. 16-1353]|uniref:metal ABC transporter solute-binding protein, Zn/Mn family n=1 Tax=Helicobacter sp. 16-1353 TaxID=2004996 RepID=UPI000DCD3463|nr:zinc ABC transporter substrate-binding protein [Helicobacter sp. 16-1353]RAX54762.1 hypothetical protein CCY99_03120 [Helicobacter sp. 16-1353]
MIRMLIAIVGLCVALNANMNVSVSVIPQAFFVKKIAGDLVDVNIMVQKGKSPETYEPSINQLKNLSKSVAYFYIGMPFEDAWLERFKSVNPDMKIIQPLKDGDLEKYLEKFTDDNHNESHSHAHHDHHSHDHHNHSHHSHDGESHDHNDDHHHNHPPHIWLSFILSKLHATQIAESLISLDSKNAEIYQKNLANFLDEIDKAYEDSQQLFKNNKKAFLVFHPAWSYIANELGLTEYAIEEDGKEAKIAHTKKILEIIKDNDIKVIFVQPQFSQKSARSIAEEANIEVKVADPLSYDWLNNLVSFLQEIAKN